MELLTHKKGKDVREVGQSMVSHEKESLLSFEIYFVCFSYEVFEFEITKTRLL